MQHAKRMCHIVICGLPVCAIFFHALINDMIEEKKVTEQEMCALIFSTTFVCNIL